MHSGPSLNLLHLRRAHVLDRLSSLRSLDSKVISEEERSAAGGLVQQVDACAAVMLRNACMVHKMVGSARRCVWGYLLLMLSLAIGFLGRSLGLDSLSISSYSQA